MRGTELHRKLENLALKHFLVEQKEKARPLLSIYVLMRFNVDP